VLGPLDASRGRGRWRASFDPDDTAAIQQAVERLLGDDALRSRLASAGPAQAARFTWEATAQATATAYRRVLA